MSSVQEAVPAVIVKKGAAQNAPPAIQVAAYRQDIESGATSSGGDIDVLQLTCKDGRLPPSVRLQFVKKVYGTLSVMLIISFGLAAPFIFATEATLSWFQSHIWVLGVVGIVILAQYIFDLCMACQLCCGGTGLMRVYFRMMKTVPWNYLYLFTFAACFGVLVGFSCASYTVQSVLLVFGLTILLILALTIYAVRTQADFTGCGAYVLVFLVGLMLLLLVGVFLPATSIYHKIIAGVGSMLFGFIIVYDTQLIFGSASTSFGGGGRAIEYTVDMYAFAAWNLYLDFINFFLYMLQLLGDRK